MWTRFPNITVAFVLLKSAKGNRMTFAKEHIFRIIPLAILAISLVSPVYAPTVSVSPVAADSAAAPTSIATVGGQNLLQDTLGKYIVVYVDTAGQLGVTYSNGDPIQTGWSTPIKSPVASAAYSRPAAVLANLNTLKIVAGGGSGIGHIVDVTVSVERDLFGNILGVTFNAPVTLDTAGHSPAATQLHDLSIIAVWSTNEPGVFSKVNALRWTITDGWRSPSDNGSTLPDTPILDTVNTVKIFTNIIQRKDNLALYLVGNRGASSAETNLVFNSAVYTGLGWQWGTQDLAFETNASRGAADTPDLDWDPVRSVVVILYDIASKNEYGVALIYSPLIKLHLDAPAILGQDEKDYAGTPLLDITNNEWGSLQVDTETGDYYLFTINTPAAPTDGQEKGTLGYTTYSGSVWQPNLTLIDRDTDNMGTAPKTVSGLGLVGGSGVIEFLYCQENKPNTVLTFVRIET